MPTIVPQRPGNTPTRFAVAPISVCDSHPVIPIIVEGLELLVARQNWDGSWGHHSTLDKLICTCHATMALQAGGYSLSERALQRARKWLCSSDIERHNNSYWILGPLAAWFDEETEVAAILRREIGKLRIAIDSGAQPHPDQYSQYFYLRIIESLEELRDQNVVSRYTKFIRNNWDKSGGWAGRPDTTSVCYGILRTFDWSFADTIKNDVIRLLSSWAAHPESKYTMWLNPISTSYTLMNLIESQLIDDPAVRKQADQAVTWLIATRGEDRMWVSDVPYGGTGDIKSKDYPTAAVLRGLLAYLSIQIPSAQASVSAVLLGNARRRIRRQRRWIVGWATIALCLLAIQFGPVIVDSINNIMDISVAGLIVSSLGLVVGILAMIFPNAREAVFVWIRGKMR